MSGGWGGRPEGKRRSLSDGLRMCERAVEGRKKIQDGKAVSKSNLDAMNKERAGNTIALKKKKDQKCIRLISLLT